jgi:hypothetical protein
MLISTDKKFQGQSAKGMFVDKFLKTDSLVVENNDNKTLTIYTPVMGYYSRMATLVFSYTSEKLIFQTAQK